jgi:protein-disulfide isomerase-like protein with CxxC motif
MSWTNTDPYNVTVPTFQGTAPTATNRYKKTTGTYDPNQDMTGVTPYSNTQTSAIDKLNSIITNGGYSPEQQQSMIAGAMAPVYQQAQQQKLTAQGDDYARGLGQSTVLNNDYSKIDQNTQSNLATITGQVTKEGADQVLPAIQAVQSGTGQYLQNQQAKAQLAAQLNMNDQQMEMAMDQLNNAASQSDADRQLTYDKMMNDFNLSSAQLNLLVQQAENDRKAKEAQAGTDFISSLLGSVLGVGGTVLGKVIPTAKATS